MEKNILHNFLLKLNIMLLQIKMQLIYMNTLNNKLITLSEKLELADIT